MAYRDPEQRRRANRNYYVRNRAAILERQKEYNARNRDAKRSRDKAYYEANRSTIAVKVAAKYRENPAPAKRRAREHQQRRKRDADWVESERLRKIAWREANRDKFRAAQERWQREHPNERNEIAALRRARLREAVVERVRREIVFVRDCGLCHICGCRVDPSDWHLDHVIPIARGGEHSYDNVAVSHPACNQRKSDRLGEVTRVF